MLKTLRCECEIDFHLQPLGPVLIKKDIPPHNDERLRLYPQDKCFWKEFFNVAHIPDDKQAWRSIPDMIFVRTKRNGRYEPYIPGSSLKGVMRSYAERIARTLRWDDDDEAIRGCCDPFERPQDNQPPTDHNTSCSEKLVYRRDKLSTMITGTLVYREVCPICKLFGCQFLQSRLLFSDGYSDYSGRPTYEATHRNVKLPCRDGIGIDRFTGGVKSKANFSYEVEEEAVFNFTLVLRNFELWQLGLLAFLFQDFQDGLIPVGSGKSRGLGRMRGIVNTIKITYFGRHNLPAQGRVFGVGQLHRGANPNEDYGFVHPDEEAIQPCPQLVSEDPFGLRHSYTFTANDVPRLLAAVAPRWITFLDKYKVPETMRIPSLQHAAQQAEVTKQGGEENG